MNFNMNSSFIRHNYNQSSSLLKRGSPTSQASDSDESLFNQSSIPLNLHSHPFNFDTRFPSMIHGLSNPQMSPEICPIHSGEIRHVCLTHKEKICGDCMALGCHSFPDHEIKRLEFLKESIDPKIKVCEDQLSKVDKFSQNIETLCEEKRKKTLALVQTRFAELRSTITSKEVQILYDVNSFYHKEIRKLQHDTGKNSIARQIITQQISEYNQITHIDKPFELMEKDLPSIFEIIQTAVQPEILDKIEKKVNEKLQEIEQNIDLTLSAQISTLEKISIITENLTLMCEETDLKLKEKLSSSEELANYRLETSPDLTLQRGISESDPISKTNLIKIEYPFQGDLYRSLDAFENIEENIFSLEFTILKDTEKMSREDISALCYIRSKLVNIQDVKMVLDYQISDEALLEMLSCLFWKQTSLKSFDIKATKKGKFKKSILYLSESLLPLNRHLSKFDIRFSYSFISRKAFDSLSQRLSGIAENLTRLEFYLGIGPVDARSLQNLFISLPNLESLQYFLCSKTANDADLNQFFLNTLPSLKKLKSFLLFIVFPVTDSSAIKLLQSFPEEWFLRLNSFQVGFQSSNITDESFKKFLDQTLPKFKNLRRFDIWTNETQVTPEMENRILKLRESFEESQTYPESDSDSDSLN